MNQPCNYTTTGGCPEPQAVQGCAAYSGGSQQTCPPPCQPPCPPPCPGPGPFPPYPPPFPPVWPGGERPVAPVTEADISCGCGCSCAPGLVAALQLLCRPRFAALTDYQQFAFITRDFVLGSSLNCPAAATTPYDNLTGPLDGEFVKITPDSCENLEVSGQIYYPNPICTGGTETACCAEGPYFDADSVRLCGLSAVAFGVTETTDFPSAEAAYNELAKLFYQATHAGCGPMPSTPVKPTPCDRSTGDIAGRGTVSLTAGPLVLGNVSVLGEVGDVLILANSEDRLFYFVCRSNIGFIG